MKNFLSTSFSDKSSSLSFLIIRIVFCTFMMVHGYDKLSHYAKMVTTFPDPLHVSRSISLQLTIFAELFCSMFVVIGLMTRVFAIPIVFCMVVAVFIINGGKPIMQHELAPLFLTAFVVVLLCGPGKISFDYLIWNPLKKATPNFQKQ